MNRLRGSISKIESSDHLSLVDVKVGEDLFSSIVIETPATATYLREGREVEMLFKETEVSIGKEIQGGLSLRNRMVSVIRRIDRGSLLSRVVLDYRGHSIISVITTRSTLGLELHEGDSVVGLVKANEMSLMALDEEASSPPEGGRP